MSSFQDRTGRAWRMELSFALWRRIKAETGIDLLDVAMPDGKALRQLVEIENIGVVLWLYVEAEAVAAGIDREAFWEGLHGPAIEGAMQALVDDLESFSRNPQFTALRVAMGEAVTKAEEIRADMLDPEGEVGAKLRSVLRSPSTPGATPASAPASLDATPTSTAGSGSSSGPPRPAAATPGTTPA